MSTLDNFRELCAAQTFGEKFWKEAALQEDEEGPLSPCITERPTVHKATLDSLAFMQP